MSAPTIPTGSTVLFDTSAFVYFLEHHPRYHRPASDVFRRVERGELLGCASVLILAELLVPLHREGEASRARGLSSVVRSMPNLQVVDVAASVAERAASLRARHSLRTPDALHVATGLERGAQWFVTNDKRLRRIEDEGMRVWLFDEQESEAGLVGPPRGSRIVP